MPCIFKHNLLIISLGEVTMGTKHLSRQKESRVVTMGYKNTCYLNENFSGSKKILARNERAYASRETQDSAKVLREHCSSTVNFFVIVVTVNGSILLEFALQYLNSRLDFQQTRSVRHCANRAY